MAKSLYKRSRPPAHPLVTTSFGCHAFGAELLFHVLRIDRLHVTAARHFASDLTAVNRKTS